ncbi:MAG: DUF11 domain-containing protein, partial [Chloroflexi bacterium]|nr:DUF11 domain-containing protein [Chloroflexota bacterium]
GKVWTYSYVVPEGSDGKATVSVGGLKKQSGSDNVELTNNAFDINSKGASVALTYSPKGNILAGETVVITATFDPEITGTPTISIDTTGTDLEAVAMTKSADGKVWTYSYSPPPNSDGEATVTIAGGLDKSGNPNQKASNNTFLIGPKEVGVKLTYSPEEGIVPGSTIVITATFDVAFTGTPSISIDTTGPDQGPFVMTSSADGKTWTLTYVVPEGSEGQATVSISGIVGEANRQVVKLSNDTFLINADNADLSVGVTATTIGVVRRGELTYTATVVNRGPMSATGVTLINELPADAIFESYGPQSLDCNLVSRSVICSLGTLEPDEGVVVSIDITVGEDAEDQLVNRTIVSGSKTDPVDENNEDTVITDVIVGVLTYIVSIQEGDIDSTGIILTDFPDPVFLGTDLTYDLDVRNGGANPVTESRLIVSLPSSVSFASAVIDFGAGNNSSKLLPNGSYNLTKAVPKVASLLFSSSNRPSEMVGECTEGSGTVICILGELQPGQEARVTIIVEPEAPGVLINQAKLVQEGLDPDAAVTAADESTTVKMMSDLSIAIKDVSSSVLQGEEFTFDFVVSNAGPSPATGVSVSNELPEGLRLVPSAVDPSTCTITAGELNCLVGNMASGESRVVSLTFELDQMATGDLVNTASVSGEEADLYSDGNSISTIISVMERVLERLKYELDGTEPWVEAPIEAFQFVEQVVPTDSNRNRWIAIAGLSLSFAALATYLGRNIVFGGKNRPGGDSGRQHKASISLGLVL